MELPSDVFKEILSYFPHPIRKTNHAEAIKKDKLLTYFLLDRELYQEPSSETFIWHDSFIEYKKWYKSWH